MFFANDKVIKDVEETVGLFKCETSDFLSCRHSGLQIVQSSKQFISRYRDWLPNL